MLKDEESLSPHHYITFQMARQEKAPENWIYGPINETRLRTELERSVEGNPVASPETLSSIMQAAYRKSVTRVRTHRGLAPYWWTDRVAELRSEAVVCRRRLTRMRAQGDAEAVEAVLQL